MRVNWIHDNDYLILLVAKIAKIIATVQDHCKATGDCNRQ